MFFHLSIMLLMLSCVGARWELCHPLSTENCPWNQRCVNGMCMPRNYCRWDGDCGPFGVCVDGRCLIHPRPPTTPRPTVKPTDPSDIYCGDDPTLCPYWHVCGNTGYCEPKINPWPTTTPKPTVKPTQHVIISCRGDHHCPRGYRCGFLDYCVRWGK
ncbi:uncharacterized protein LOC134249356 isoform X2 [Saccostrea cucullata]|uniref:uncharacterized protein LOC134249356 isoform X2 n=1 Tax=Saccostrea cuccullata TaxID=36930 RepID=UPI002ED49A73